MHKKHTLPISFLFAVSRSGPRCRGWRSRPERHPKVFPAVPAHTKINLFTSLGSTLQLFSQLLVIQGFIIIHLELVTVLVPVFQVIIGDVAQLTINLCILVRPDRICITISMTCFDGQTSVTELAVPTTFTIVGQTTRIGDQDVVAAICHFNVVREFVGHGIGKDMHEDPQVPNYGKRGYGTMLKKGLCIAIEPMITLGNRQIVMERDGWTVRTRDCKYAAHFEHTIAVRSGEADILSSFKFIEEVLGDKAI